MCAFALTVSVINRPVVNLGVINGTVDDQSIDSLVWSNFDIATTRG